MSKTIAIDTLGIQTDRDVSGDDRKRVGIYDSDHFDPEHPTRRYRLDECGYRIWDQELLDRYAPDEDGVIYPSADGDLMADNTTQADKIDLLKRGTQALYADRDDVFVAGDLLWYPVQGSNGICAAPDVMVAIGRPSGPRRSYQQWKEGNIAPQVVFEVLSDSNYAPEMRKKHQFYQDHGVQEYYVYDPFKYEFDAWLRSPHTNLLEPVTILDSFTSPLLGIRFDISDMPHGDLKVYRPDGEPFTEYLEERQERVHFQQVAAETAKERDAVAQERDQQRERAERLVARLRELGIDAELEP